MEKLLESFYYSFLYDNRYLYILEGLKNTLIIALFAVLIGIIIGTIIAITRNYYENTNK